MKDIFRRYFAVVLVVVMITGVCALFSVRKSGYFVDEVYTFGLSNSYYKPFVIDLAEGGIVDKELSRETLLDYLTVSEGERFAAGSVYYNQTQDVHPPLYYWLFNFVYSLFPGFSKWPAMALNFVLYMLTMLMLWKLCMELFSRRHIAAAALALYGLSGIGVSTMLMVRMYVLLTLLTVTLAYLTARLMRTRERWLYPLVGLTIFAGLMTQYYFVFYAFFLCAAYDIRALVRRDFRDFLRFSVWAVAGVACLVLAFPACLDQLFADALVSGGNAAENIRDVAAYGERFATYWKRIKFSVRGMQYALYAAALIALALSPRLIKGLRGRKLRLEALLVILPALITYAVVVVVSPVLEPRYIYNIMPVLALLPCFIMYVCMEGTEGVRFRDGAAFALAMLAACWALWTVRTYPPDYLYPEHNGYNAAVEPYTGGACVYFNDERKGAMTQDLVQLIRFDGVFVANDPDSEKLAEYLAEKDSDTLIVYIDTNKFWSSGFSPEDILPELERATGYGNAQLLYSYELSQTYLLTR